MKFFQKAVACGLSPANILTWCSIKCMMVYGLLTGTLSLKIKAFLLGVKTGRNIRAHGPVGLIRWPGGRIYIGDNVSFISSWRRATASAIGHPVRLRVYGKGAAIIIGSGSQLTGASITARSTTITIGRNVLIGPDCVIVDSDFHAHWPPEARADNPGQEKDTPVLIGDCAWLGMRCIVLKGVTIGAGAIIGAGSVVTRDVPPNCVACGNPARIVARRDQGD